MSNLRPTNANGAILCVLLVAVLITACTKKAHIYNLTTGEMIPAQFSYNGTGKGTLSAVTAAGEKFKGDYVTIPSGETSWGTIYASVYGPKGSASGTASSFSSTTNSQQRGTAIATGDKGTIIQCEYVTSVWNGGGTGACKDNHNVLYKLMF